MLEAVSLVILFVLFGAAAGVIEGYFKIREWRTRRSADTLTQGWWKSRAHEQQRVEYHGPVIKFPIRK